MERNQLVKGIRGLCEKNVAPNSIERQKVYPALKIFRPEVTATLQLYSDHKVEGFEDVDATIKFIKTIHWWFAVHNVSNTTEHYKKRLSEKCHSTRLTTTDSLS